MIVVMPDANTGRRGYFNDIRGDFNYEYFFFKELIPHIKQIRWYISCGDDDFLYEGNSRMHIVFRKSEIAHEYRVKDGGHTWTYWRMELPLVLEFISKSFNQF